MFCGSAGNEGGPFVTGKRKGVMTDIGYLGLDIGSISTNLVLINSCGDVVSETYIRGSGSPIASVQKGMARIEREGGADGFVRGVGATGSGRYLISEMVGAGSTGRIS